MTTEPIFIQVGELADGFTPLSNKLDTVNLLTNISYKFYFDNNTEVTCQFISSTQLMWGEMGLVSYRATMIRDGIFFVDFIHPAKTAASISLILDSAHNQVTVVEGMLPNEQQTHLDAFSRVTLGLELTGVTVSIYHGTVNNPYSPENITHAVTDELVGLRNIYSYSKTERYEHVYLNESFYAWQCLEGVEKGLADVDRCHYLKITEQIYLFIWREKIIPTLGVVMIDLQQKRTDGKIFGYRDATFSVLSNFPMGAHADILNRTVYPTGQE
ncbi:MoaF C-terminal domain-containing protein [Klebsiella variicola]|uniref:MoaF C-terminal domain-containing protein n=1 Tax=Klebsiella variicola TaxID=244366 RepID=UPI0009BAC3AD|nr:MoaF C-terminal domain-containing protein [Klebsiella variicola]SLY50233.1 MoaF protein [Klebsiella variicola]